MTRPIELILDDARWAPSGDNTQPWRLRIVSDREVDILGRDTRADCVYDLDGDASRIAHGCLLETLRIAASAHGFGIEWSCQPEGDSPTPVYSVRLTPQPDMVTDPLQPFIRTRAVQRRPMRTQALTTEHITALTAAASPYRVVWMSGFSQRLSIARLNYRSARIRLTIPEAFEVHRRVIEWGARFSEDRERCGLRLQPELTPLIFSRYARKGRSFTRMAEPTAWAHRVSDDLDTLFGSSDARSAVFMCRLGYGPVARARSLRLPLDKLLAR
jgi:hypothetical protein